MIEIKYTMSESGGKITLQVSQEVADVLVETDNKPLALDKQDERNGLLPYQEGISELALFEQQKSVPDIVVQRERYFRLWTAIAKLPPAQRRRILLYYIDGYTLEEIAEREGVRHQVVSRSISAAKKNLHKFLKTGCKIASECPKG